MVTFTKIKNLGIVLTRYEGTDGVTLETKKWCYVLAAMGYSCYFFTGASDSEPENTMILPYKAFRRNALVISPGHQNSPAGYTA